MADARDLTTVATAAEALGVVANDAKLPRLVTAASRAIAAHVGYDMHRRTGVVEKPAGLGGYYLFLRAGQVTAVSSIVVDEEELDANSYALDSQLMGRIVFLDGADPLPFTGEGTDGIAATSLRARREDRISVTFDAGWTTPGQVAITSSLTRDLPEDIEQACIEVVSTLYRRLGSDPDVTSRSIGDASIGYGADSLRGGRTNIPLSARGLLAPYRKPTRRTF